MENQTSIYIDIAGIIISLIGYYFVWKEIKEIQKQREQDKNIKRVETAINIAEEFKILLSSKLKFIFSSLDIKEYTSCISSIPDNLLISFTLQEFNELCSKYPDLHVYNEYINIKNTKCICQMAYAYTFLPNIKKDEHITIQNYINYEWDIKKIEEDFSKSKEQLEHFKKELKPSIENDLLYYRTRIFDCYQVEIVDSLNSLEYLSMKLTSKLADDEIIYKSLHQVFIKYVKLLYPVICQANNTTNADKYYSHIIQLYSEWANKYIQEKNKEKIIEQNNLTNKSIF